MTYLKGNLADPIFNTLAFTGEFGLPYNSSMDAGKILWDYQGTKGIKGGQEPNLLDFNQALNQYVALWLGDDGKYYAMLKTVTAPFIHIYKPSINAKPYTPNGKIAGKLPTDPTKCPCDCKEVTTQKTYFLHREKQTNGDIPINISNNKVVCTSKDTGKKYKIDCNDNISIQQQLNMLADAGIGRGGGSNKIASAPCPCDCKESIVNEIWFLSTVRSNTPINLSQTETICTTTDANNRKIDCVTFNNAINSGGLSDFDITKTIKENETGIAIGIVAVTGLAIIFAVIS